MSESVYFPVFDDHQIGDINKMNKKEKKGKSTDIDIL